MLTNLSKWREIGASETVINWIANGVLLPFSSTGPPPSFEFSNRKLNKEQVRFVDCELKKLVNSGVIKKCVQKPHISPINVVPKKGINKWRLIIDLRVLNSFITPPKFTNEKISVISSIVFQGDLLVTLDLKDGFYHVPVAHEHQKFLGFSWKKQYYCFTKLPFGLNASPYFFSKTLRPVLSYARAQGLRAALFVDDWFLAAAPNDIENHKTFLISILEDLGWTINYTKSSLTPESSKTWIGYVISTESSNPKLCIPPNRVHKLKRDIQRALRKNALQAKALARIAGQCVAMGEVILPTKLLLRNVYRVLATKRSWNDMVIITESAKQDLRWWLQALKNWNNRELRKRPVDLQIFTDASMTGWGAWLHSNQAAGFWNRRLKNMPSNYREITAVLMALVSFLPMIKGKSVQIVSDNISTVAYLNHQGGSAKNLSDIATSIWSLAFRMDIHISARYLAGKENILADRLSRLNPCYEWMIHPRIFHWLDTMWGPHTVDRFATLTTTQLPRYNSRFYDPRSEGVDALAQQNWGTENNFVNPPFCMIPKIIELLKKQKAVATLITPMWPAQVWYQTLMKMAIAKPMVIHKSSRTLQAAVGTPEPLRNKKWRLIAWRVSGDVT